jgi:hypothetical protein
VEGGGQKRKAETGGYTPVPVPFQWVSSGQRREVCKTSARSFPEVDHGTAGVMKMERKQTPNVQSPILKLSVKYNF